MLSSCPHRTPVELPRYSAGAALANEFEVEALRSTPSPLTAESPLATLRPQVIARERDRDTASDLGRTGRFTHAASRGEADVESNAAGTAAP